MEIKKQLRIYNPVIHFWLMMIKQNKSSLHIFSLCLTFNHINSVDYLIYLLPAFSSFVLALFKQVTTITGRHLSLTSSHLLPIDKQGYVMAKYLRTGMNIYVMNEDGVLITETIANVTDVVKQGYIAPLTEEGTLIVNNVAASCYATINSHHVAHAVLTPMRWWYRLFGISKESDGILGVRWFPKMLYEMTAYLIPSIIHK
jgi:hypothetical protein